MKKNREADKYRSAFVNRHECFQAYSLGKGEGLEKVNPGWSAFGEN